MSAPVTPYRIEVLSKAHSREGFSCGEPSLDRYLLHQARQDAEKRVAAAFVLLELPGTRVLGYYTLSSSVIDIGQVPAQLGKRMPRYPQLPVTLLGRLARDECMKGHHTGELLLMDALAKALQSAGTIGSIAVVVDAKSANAQAFYQSFGFTLVQEQPRRLFLPMSVVKCSDSDTFAECSVSL